MSTCSYTLCSLEGSSVLRYTSSEANPINEEEGRRHACEAGVGKCSSILVAFAFTFTAEWQLLHYTSRHAFRLNPTQQFA
ncbi:hypothetical protein F2P81_021275 [Scophthalmus maximus]|uniref:Uncharacterized protein n=1 Tax=Scophthalmus maximus TaxID=52904 RepID=A0A6A4S2Z6_SCOMX|nr:hypothetical protein F2P81_021275 [Scophthalmus maximus]